MLFRSKKISKAFAWAQMTRGRMRSKSESISDTSSMQSMVTNGLLSSPVLLAWHPDRSPAVPQPAIRAHRVQMPDQLPLPAPQHQPFAGRARDRILGDPAGGLDEVHREVGVGRLQRLRPARVSVSAPAGHPATVVRRLTAPGATSGPQ